MADISAPYRDAKGHHSRTVQILHWWYIYHSGRCKEGTHSGHEHGWTVDAPTPHLPPHHKFKTLLVETAEGGACTITYWGCARRYLLELFKFVICFLHLKANEISHHPEANGAG